MKNRSYDWNLNINRDFWLTCDTDFMSEERINDICKKDCVMIDTCLLICDLLSNNKYNEAIRILWESKQSVSSS